MLCPKCNRKKSAKIPTYYQTKALQRRRKRYRNPGVPLVVGEKYRG